MVFIFLGEVIFLIKGQTLHDYHNHVLKIIMKVINREEMLMNESEQIISFLKECDLVKHDVELLYELRQMIIDDWENSNYSKVRK